MMSTKKRKEGEGGWGGGESATPKSWASRGQRVAVITLETSIKPLPAGTARTIIVTITIFIIVATTIFNIVVRVIFVVVPIRMIMIIVTIVVILALITIIPTMPQL